MRGRSLGGSVEGVCACGRRARGGGMGGRGPIALLNNTTITAGCPSGAVLAAELAVVASVAPAVLAAVLGLKPPTAGPSRGPSSVCLVLP